MSDDPREDFYLPYSCYNTCNSLSGQNRINCLKKCEIYHLNKDKSNMKSRKLCLKNQHCNSSEICILPGPYTGGLVGHCMANPQTEKTIKENFIFNSQTVQRKACPPRMFFNYQTGRCEKRFQGPSSPAGVHSVVQGPDPFLNLPGSTLPGYGVGSTDPFDVPVMRNGHFLRLHTDQ